MGTVRDLIQGRGLGKHRHGSEVDLSPRRHVWHVKIRPGIGGVLLCLPELFSHPCELRAMQSGRYRDGNGVRMKVIGELLGRTGAVGRRISCCRTALLRSSEILLPHSASSPAWSTPSSSIRATSMRAGSVWFMAMCSTS